MNTTPVESPYLTADEAAEYLRFPSVHWFRKAVRTYGIPYLRRGRRMFFTKQALDEFMAVADDATNPTPGGARKRSTAA
jgi:excisionase family DNA binding protein